MKHAAPVMRRQESGSIINNGSIAGSRAGYSSSLIYGAANDNRDRLMQTILSYVGYRYPVAAYMFREDAVHNGEGQHYFDAETIRYLKFTGRKAATVALVEAYAKKQGMWRTAKTPDPIFTDSLELDLGTVVPSLAG